MEILKTDVLVIGAGGAGMRAALAARDQGADVLIASKIPLGKSTCTYLSAGVFAIAAGGLTEERHLEATLSAGRGINDTAMAEILVKEAPERVRELESLGLKGGRWGRGTFSCDGKISAWSAP
ncbi:MAG TPA: FAD-binding protein, partial [Thermodesulfobacteriota bacterium]|nr:FAD-binding protein [Thermodesulfobacteriota bacterium]